MKRTQLLLILLLATTGASASQDLNVISVQHDKYRGVTCWVLNDSALSCLPDSQLQHQPDPAVKPLQNRAAAAANQPQDGVNPASTSTPRRQREVFQL